MDCNASVAKSKRQLKREKKVANKLAGNATSTTTPPGAGSGATPPGSVPGAPADDTAAPKDDPEAAAAAKAAKQLGLAPRTVVPLAKLYSVPGEWNKADPLQAILKACAGDHSTAAALAEEEAVGVRAALAALKPSNPMVPQLKQQLAELETKTAKLNGSKKPVHHLKKLRKGLNDLTGGTALQKEKWKETEAREATQHALHLTVIDASMQELTLLRTELIAAKDNAQKLRQERQTAKEDHFRECTEEYNLQVQRVEKEIEDANSAPALPKDSASASGDPSAVQPFRLL
jgi:hypothetical protein